MFLIAPQPIGSRRAGWPRLPSGIATRQASQPTLTYMAQQWEYVCTANAHDAATVTHHMNEMARAGWELLTVAFAIRGETGTHTFFWRRPVSTAAPAPRT